MPTVSFENRVVIVTGAGGALGRAHALEIARRGGSVVVNDLGCSVAGFGASRDPADRVVAEIRATGGKAVASYDSVGTVDGAQRTVATALESFGRVDALINNAGILRNLTIEETSLDDFEAHLSIHLAGAFNMSKAVWPHMKAQRYGRIVFTSSSSGMFGSVLQSGYAAAKAGVTGLMNTLAQEGEPHAILCNGLMPNAMSKMAESYAEKIGSDALMHSMEVMAQFQNSMEPEFTAPLAVYLASEACHSGRGIYSSLGGRFARVFIGATHGWQGSRTQPSTPDDVAQHFGEICDPTGGYITPSRPQNEFELVLAHSSKA